MPDAAAERRPSADRWSVLEIIEHTAIVDNLFSARIAAQEPGEEEINNKERELSLFDKVSSPDQSIMAPQITHPKGIFHTCADALEHFENTRLKVGSILAAKEREVRCLRVAHPVLGTISGYEAFLLIAAHTQRHVAQILAIGTIGKS